MALVIRAPDVDHAVEPAPAELVVMVGDVRRKIGGLARGTNHHIVPFVAQRDGIEPERTASLGQMASLPQRRDRPIVVAGGGVLVLEQPALAEPVVEIHADGVQVIADQVDHLLPRDVADPADGRRLRQLQQVRSFGLHDFCRNVGDVISLIPVFRHLRLPAQSLLVTGPDRAVERLHLGTGVVDVVLPRNFVPGRLHGVRQGAAQHRPAGVPHVYRPRRIDADELDHHLTSGTRFRRAEPLPGGDDGFDLLLQPCVAELEVDETRWRRLQTGNLRTRLDAFRDQLGQVHRIRSCCPRQSQREVGGEIAVLRIVGPFDLDVRNGVHIDHPVAVGLLQGGSDDCSYGVFD